MKSNRRNFLKLSGLTGMSLAGSAVLGNEIPIPFDFNKANLSAF